jgi:hypothetical protein
MGVFSSGSKWKQAARGALASAQALENQQKDIDFQRGLLSNIRQQRMAQAQLSLMNYSESFTSSSAIGASANVDSALASEMKYSYESSQRAEDIQGYQQAAQQYMDKYASQQKKKAAGFAVVGAVAGAVTGGLGFGLMGAAIGTQIGQGLGQMASNTGQFETGLNNVISGASQAYQAHEYENNYERLLDRLTPKNFELTSIDPKTGKPIQGSTVTTTYTPGSLSYLNQNIFN